MPAVEELRFALAALQGHRLRSALSALGVAIGVAAVVLLTSLGEGVRTHIVAQFAQFGTSLVAVTPGRVKTFGLPGVLGGTTHRLTIDDAEALRRIGGVEHVVPVAFGQALVEAGQRGRNVYVYGVNHEAAAAWRFAVAQGSFLPAVEAHRQGASVVLGPKLARELFGVTSPLGQRVRVGGRSFLVVGVMAAKGQLLGFDLDDAAYIPVASAMSIFNLGELVEIDVTASSPQAIPSVVAEIRQVLAARHRGEEDFTVTSQTEMLDTFDRVLGIVTVAVSAIAGISLVVGAMGILTILWISVHERTAEVGLLRALGVTPGRIGRLFLLEAVILALVGGLLGLAAGVGLGEALRAALPGLPLRTPIGAMVSAVVMSLAVGVAAGFLPARRAAGLDPIEALRAE